MIIYLICPSIEFLDRFFNKNFRRASYFSKFLVTNQRQCSFELFSDFHFESFSNIYSQFRKFFHLGG